MPLDHTYSLPGGSRGAVTTCRALPITTQRKKGTRNQFGCFLAASSLEEGLAGRPKGTKRWSYLCTGFPRGASGTSWTSRTLQREAEDNTVLVPSKSQGAIILRKWQPKWKSRCKLKAPTVGPRWPRGPGLPATPCQRQVETGSVISVARDPGRCSEAGPHARTRVPASPEKDTDHHTRAPFSPLAPGNPGNPVEPWAKGMINNYCGNWHF